MEELEKLFGSGAKVKIMKLFLLNPDVAFEPTEVRKRCQVTSKSARRELNLLASIKFITNHSVVKPRTGRQAGGYKKAKGWILNQVFPYIKPLQNLLVYTSALTQEDIKRKFNKAGNIKLMVTAGVFIQDWSGRLDLLVVGDNLRKPAITAAVRSLESEIGRELKYSIFSTEDFQYRLLMCDKLIRDILDYPHDKVVNKLEIE